MAKAKVLRELLQKPGVHQGPACFDALGAKLIESAGFPYCITSGFSIAASRLALPDTGFISYGEMLDQGQLIAQAVSIPIIVDADDGYGNAMNLKRTVKGFIAAGFAGILLEDQVPHSLTPLSFLLPSNSFNFLPLIALIGFHRLRRKRVGTRAAGRCCPGKRR